MMLERRDRIYDRLTSNWYFLMAASDRKTNDPRNNARNMKAALEMFILPQLPMFAFFLADRAPASLSL